MEKRFQTFLVASVPHEVGRVAFDAHVLEHAAREAVQEVACIYDLSNNVTCSAAISA